MCSELCVCIYGDALSCSKCLVCKGKQTNKFLLVIKTVNMLLWCRERIILYIVDTLFCTFLPSLFCLLLFLFTLGHLTLEINTTTARMYHHFTVSFCSPCELQWPFGSQRFANLHPAMLSSYWTAWNCFKSFHFHHKLQFPNFSLTTTIYTPLFFLLQHLYTSDPTQIYKNISSIHFSSKLISNHQWPTTNNPQISLLIKDFQKFQPSHLDSCLPLTC